MPKPASPPAASVYQLRVVLRAVSPLIWRRVLVRGDATLAELHAVLQAAFGWSDVHPDRFKIQGREYDSTYESREVRLADLDLRVTERFVYDYDLGDLWRHDIRVEQILDPVAGAPSLHRRAARGPTRGLRRSVGVPRADPGAPLGAHAEPHKEGVSCTRLCRVRRVLSPASSSVADVQGIHQIKLVAARPARSHRAPPRGSPSAPASTPR